MVAGRATLLPAAQAYDWPQFRGPNRDNISRETGLLPKWPAKGPRVLWSVPVAQGYAGAAIVVGGPVYHHDYEEAKGEWCVNCRFLADGKLIWQFREKREIRPNHGITRTVPAVDGRYVCSLDLKAVLHCLDPRSSKEIWRKNLVTEYKSTIPPWYNGQCPYQEADRIIIGVGGSALMVALEKATGKEIWRTPNTSNHRAAGWARWEWKFAPGARPNASCRCRPCGPSTSTPSAGAAPFARRTSTSPARWRRTVFPARSFVRATPSSASRNAGAGGRGAQAGGHRAARVG